MKEELKIDKDDSILILGSSNELKERKLGKLIDTFDVVCRINNGGNQEVFNRKNRKILGTKKNIWFCLEPSGFRRNSPTLIKQFDLVFVNHKKTYEDNKLKYKNLRLFPEGLSRNCKISLYSFNGFGRHYEPTSGIKAIFYFLPHIIENNSKPCRGTSYNSISLLGFDGFKSGHWYGNKYIKNQDESDKYARKGLSRHNVSKEYEYLEDLEKNNLISFL